MPLAKLKPVFHEEAPIAPAVFAADLDGVAATASPARLLQQRLQASTVPTIDKWPLRNTVALVVTTSLALWMAILTAATETVRAIA